MNNKYAAVALLLALVASAPAGAATQWSTKDYNLYAGDFNADGKQDLLYVALSTKGESGIALSNGSEPIAGHQIWNSTGFGIPWHSGIYQPVIGDFNWDGRSDIFMQRQTPGDHYLLLANADGTFSGIAQTVPNTYGGQVWSHDQHTVLAIGATNLSDPQHQKGDRLMLQAARRGGTNAIFSTSFSQLITSTTLKTWADGYLGFQWNAAQAVLYTADFNADGEGDLLIQAKPDIVLIDYDVNIPVPHYRPGSFGIVYSPVTLTTSVAWDRKRSGVDWSATNSNLVIADVDGDGRPDILVQPRQSGSTLQLVRTNPATSQLYLDSPSNISLQGISDVGGGAYRIVGANFDGGASSGVYLQATSATGTDYIAATIATSGSTAVTAVTAQAQSGAAHAVGIVPGGGGVSPTGAATYSVPIDIPAGTNGLQPTLSFEYSSAAGNGILGVGWHLGGMSAISRCNKTIVQDVTASAPMLTNSDAFCLDGSRLMLKTGTYGTANAEYRTEIESYSKIVAVNASIDTSSSWLVYGRDGLIYEYGATEDSRIQTVGTTIARLWALNKIRDRNNNYISFTYQDTDGSYRPLTIQYTQHATLAPNGSTKIQFVYEGIERPDKLYAYRHGQTSSAIAAYINEFHRLISVDVVNVATLAVVRSYSISYDPSGGSGSRSRINGINLCAGQTCVPATTLQWTNGTPSWSSTESSVSQALVGKKLVGDINGDGRDDMVFSSSTTSGAGTWYYMLGGSSGLGAAQNTTIVNYNQIDAQIIEFNGDGMADLLVPCNGTATWCVLQANGSGFNPPFNTGAASTGSTGLVMAADVDGDGRDDLIRQDRGIPNTFMVRLRNAGTGFNNEVAAWTVEFANLYFNGDFRDLNNRGLRRRIDFNGDGREDFVLELKYVSPDPGDPVLHYLATFRGMGNQISRGANLCGGPNGGGCLLTNTGDFNGDGLSDLIVRKQTEQYQLRVGTGGETADLFLANLGGPASNGTFSPMVLDYDGDGLDDLLVAKGSPNATWWLARSTGNSLESVVDLGLPASDSYAADVNGDGLGDIVRIDGSFIRTRLHNGVYPNLLDRATDGFGMYVDFDYVSLPNAGSIYTKGTGAPLGTLDYKGPMYVVSTRTMSDGLSANGSFATTFAYQQARIHTWGRGFMGFNKVTATDMRNNVRIETTYEQNPGEFQSIGMSTLMQVKQYSGTLISETTNTWEKAVLATGRAAFLKQQVVKQYEVEGSENGDLITTTTTDNLFDSASGIIYDSTSKVVEAATANGIQSGVEYKQRTYHPLANLVTDTANWCLGLPQRTEYINSHTQDAVQGAAQTRLVTRTFDSKCRLATEAVEPNDAALRVDTALTYDDTPGEAAPDFGNLLKVSVTGASMTARVTSRAFTTDGRFVQSVTNPAGETTTLAFDPKLGVPLSVTDPNALVVSFEYDALGRQIKETRPDGTYTKLLLRRCSADSCLSDPLLRSYARTQEYGSDAQLIRTDDQYFDGAGRLKYQDSASLIDDLSSRIAYEYDAFGHVIQQSAPYFIGNTAYATMFAYDLAGRVKSTTRAIDSSTIATQTTNIYYEGLTTRVVDAQSKTQKQILNAAGLLARSADHDNYSQTFTYDRFANLVQVSDSQTGVLQTMTYNIRGMKTGQTDVDAGIWAYQSNALGELEYIRDAKTIAPNWTTRMQYDSLGRMKSRQDYAESVISNFNYGTSQTNHNIGRLESMTSPAYSETRFYDNRGRPQKRTINNGAAFDIEYEYNTLGLLDKLTYPTTVGASRLAVRYQYANGLPKSITEVVASGTPTVFWQATDADAFGNVTKETLGNGLQTSRTYDALTGWLSTIKTGPSATPTSIQNLSYKWDKVGNLQSRTDSRQSLTEDFYYDSIYRLSCSTLNVTPRSSCAALSAPQKNFEQTYQANGNIASRAGVGNYAYHATKVHAVTTAGASSVYGYDPNGNVNSRNGSSITWYSYNLPNTIGGTGGSQSQFFYTPDRQRWKQVAMYGTTQEETLNIGGLVDKVTIGTNTSWKHYIVGPTGAVAVQIRTASTQATHYFTKDHLGSVDSITDETNPQTGPPEVRLSFGAFGARRGEAGWTGNPTPGDWTQITNTTRNGFTSHEMLDNLNLTHMNGRVYDQITGRFLSPDPFVTEPGSTQSFNRYSYTYNNPLRYTDPSGFDPDDMPPGPGVDPCDVFCRPQPAPRGPGACLGAIPRCTNVEYYNCWPPGTCAPRHARTEPDPGHSLSNAVDPPGSMNGGPPGSVAYAAPYTDYGLPNQGSWAAGYLEADQKGLRGADLSFREFVVAVLLDRAIGQYEVALENMAADSDFLTALTGSLAQEQFARTRFIWDPANLAGCSADAAACAPFNPTTGNASVAFQGMKVAGLISGEESAYGEPMSFGLIDLVVHETGHHSVFNTALMRSYREAFELRPEIQIPPFALPAELNANQWVLHVRKFYPKTAGPQPALPAETITVTAPRLP